MLDVLAPILGFTLEFVIAFGIVGIIMIIEKILNWKDSRKKYTGWSLCLPKPTNKSAI